MALLTRLLIKVVQYCVQNSIVEMLQLIKLLPGRESYGLKFYQPNRLIVLTIERLDENAVKAPFTFLLTESVIDVSCGLGG